MMTNQPKWRFLANLGDVSPVEYGGYFIFTDDTGVYPPEAEYWDADSREAYRFDLEQLHLVEGHLISKRLYDKVLFGGPDALPYPLKDYVEWFDDDLSGVASATGFTVEQLQAWFCSDDPLDRARAYREVGEFWGFENLDSYPLHLTKREAEKRYKDWK
jgi:hypothetical protein